METVRQAGICRRKTAVGLEDKELIPVLALWPAERSPDFGADLGRIFGRGLQLGLKVLGLDAESFLEIVGAQQPVNEGMVCGDLPLDISLERADLVRAGGRKAAHRLLDHVDVALGRRP